MSTMNPSHMHEDQALEGSLTQSTKPFVLVTFEISIDLGCHIKFFVFTNNIAHMNTKSKKSHLQPLTCHQDNTWCDATLRLTQTYMHGANHQRFTINFLWQQYKLSSLLTLSFFLSVSTAVTYIFTAPTCTTMIVTLEPCALNDEFQRLILKFNEISLLCEYH